MIPNVLSIAGSDPSGGAGVQADIKTFSALGVYGMGVLTSLTSQNTIAVSQVFDVPFAFVAQQLNDIFTDIRVDGIKIGMMGTSKTIQVISAILYRCKECSIVFDPVMYSGDGYCLTSDDALEVMKEEFIPLVDVITPNIPEAEALLGHVIAQEDMEEAAQELLKLGVGAVYLKGGHVGKSDDVACDVYVTSQQSIKLEQPRLDVPDHHGTGCALSSAFSAYLARGLPGDEAAQKAQAYVYQAMQNASALSVGHGYGPISHLLKS